MPLLFLMPGSLSRVLVYRQFLSDLPDEPFVEVVSVKQAEQAGKAKSPDREQVQQGVGGVCGHSRVVGHGLPLTA